MNMKKWFLVFWVLVYGTMAAQDTLTLTPEGFQPQWMLLRYLKGSSAYYLKAADSVREGHPVYFIMENQPAGEYAIQYDVNHSRGFRFIYNGENVRIAFDPSRKYDARVEQSRENKVYFAFLRQWDSLNRAIRKLKSDYIRTPSEQTQAEYARLKKRYENLFARYRKIDTNMLAWHFIRAHYKQMPEHLFNAKAPYVRFAEKHYFDGIDMNDTVLYRSNILTDRIYKYVMEIPVPAYGPDKSKVYIHRIGEVFSRLHYLPMRADMLAGLAQVFSRRDRSVTDTLVSYYRQLPEEYRNEALLAHLQSSPIPVKGEKLPVARLMALGKLHIDGRKPYHLFVFYSSDCPHCKRALPAVYKHLKNNKNVQVIAIGLETEPEHWHQFITSLKGWQHLMATDEEYNRIVTEYGIEYTPTWFLTDKKLNILEKVTGEHKIKKLLNFYKL